MQQAQPPWRWCARPGLPHLLTRLPELLEEVFHFHQFCCESLGSVLTLLKLYYLDNIGEN